MRIAHNLIIDHFRKEKQLNLISCESYDSSLINSARIEEKCIESQMIHTQISKDVRMLVDMLPDDQKQVVILRHFMDMSFKEIAIFSDVSINTALGRMRYAIINLKKMAEERNLILQEV
jgi:RNA polymerase sigma-70 factor (ECF subfamily)